MTRTSSIWSMTRYSYRGYEHVLTIEVDPNNRTIVQAGEGATAVRRPTPET